MVTSPSKIFDIKSAAINDAMKSILQFEYEKIEIRHLLPFVYKELSESF